MPKDYQEVEAFKAKLWELGLTAKDIDVDAFLTTYGNSRVEEIIKIAEGMKITSMSGIGLDIDEKAHNQALTDLIKSIKK